MSPTSARENRSRFTAIWTYPWDLAAEGLDDGLARIRDTGLSAISLAVSYHAGMLLLPHNPLQKVRFLEDGAVYFAPETSRFQGLAIQPRPSDLVRSEDMLEKVCEAARKHGLEVVAWTVCCHNSYQGQRHPDLTIHNAFGDPYPFALCPAQPAVQDYLSALLSDLSRYPLRTIQLESYGYMGFRHGHHHEKILVELGPLAAFLMGLCFCPACQERAVSEGLDFQRIRDRTRQYLLAAFEGQAHDPGSASRDDVAEVLPELVPYLETRDHVVTEMVLRLAESSQVPLSLLGAAPELGKVRQAIDEVTVCAYCVAPEEVAQRAERSREQIGAELTLAIGLDAAPHLSPSAENLAAKVRKAWEAGADGLYFYNYGLMPLRSLRWLAAALERG